MGWTLTRSLDEFTAAATPFLRARPAENSVTLTVTATLRRHGPHAYGTEPPVFGWWRPAGGGPVGATVLRTPPRPPLLSRAPAEAARALAGAWPTTRGPAAPGGVRGDADAGRAFATAWRARTGTGVVVGRETRLFRLGTLTPREPAPPGAARVAGPADRALLLRWFDGFAADTGTEAAGGRAVDDALALGLCTLWELPGGEPVAMAGTTVPVDGAVRVVRVRTPAPHRGRGYAGAVTAAVTRAALEAGARHLVLFTDLADPVSNGLYRRLGYVPVRDFTELGFVPAPAR